MNVQVIHPLVTLGVPRNTPAPWLDKKSTKYKLYRPLVVFLVDPKWCPEGVYIIVPAGYVTDFSSIPWYVWWLYPPGYGEARTASVIHDYIYSHLHWYYSKAFADEALIAIMTKMDAPARALRRFRWAVKLGGRGGWTYRNSTRLSIHWKTKYPLLKYPEDLQIAGELEKISDDSATFVG